MMFSRSHDCEAAQLAFVRDAREPGPGIERWSWRAYGP